MTTISARIIADSICETSTGEARLTTMLVRYPRIIHAEHLRHRLMSFCVESSRARPFIAKPGAHAPGTLDMVEADPYVPIEWGANKPGMQAGEQLSPEQIAVCEYEWREACRAAIYRARLCHAQGLVARARLLVVS